MFNLKLNEFWSCTLKAAAVLTLPIGFVIYLDNKIHELNNRQIGELKGQIEETEDLSIRHAKLEQRVGILEAELDSTTNALALLKEQKWEEKYKASVINSETMQFEINKLKESLESASDKNNGDDEKYEYLVSKIASLENEKKKLEELYTTSDSNLSGRTIGNESLEVQQLLSTLNGISMSLRKSFLIKRIPDIKGGVSCEPFAKMIELTSPSLRAGLVVSVAEYINKPLNPECTNKISELIPPSLTGNAMNALLDN